MMYEVGQVLYLVALKTAKVVPVRVTAVTITKTLEGECVSHRLEFADAPGREASLEDLNVEIFKTPDELEEFMLQNARNAVQQEVKQAQEKTLPWVPVVETPEPKQKATKKPVRKRRKKTVTMPPADEPITVVLEDGVKANVTLPAELS